MASTDDAIYRLRAALRRARGAQRGAFQAWEIAKYTIQDDLSPPARIQRRQVVRTSKRLCLRAARQAAGIEACILALKME